MVIFLTVFIDLVGFGIIIPLNPYLAREFGADPLQVGLLMTIYSLMQFLCAPFWGHWSDKIGRRPIILLSLLGASMAHLWFAFAETLTTLFLARALAGLFGGNISTAMAYIADVTPKEDRSKGMGLIGAAFGLGFVLGPFIGGIFGHIGEWLGDGPPLGSSLPAVVASLICFINFLMAWRFLTESLPRLRDKQFQQKRPRFQMLTKYLRRPVMGRLMCVYFLSSLAMAHMEASLFLYVQDLFNWSLVQASFGFAYVGCIMVLTQGVLIRRFMPLWGERRLLLSGLLMAGLGLATIGWSSAHIWLLAGAVTLLGIGVGLANPSTTGSISLLAGGEEQGTAMGVNQSLAALGRIMGPALGGWFYRDMGYSTPFWVAGCLMILGVLLALPIYAQLPDTSRK